MLVEKDGYVQLVQIEGTNNDSAPSPDSGNSLLYATARGLTIQDASGNRAMLDIPVLLSASSLPMALTSQNEAIVGLAYTIEDVVGATALYQLDVVVAGTLTPDADSTAIRLAVSVNDGSPDVTYMVPFAGATSEAFGGSFRFFILASAEDVVQVVSSTLAAADVASVDFAVASLRRLAYIDLQVVGT